MQAVQNDRSQSRLPLMISIILVIMLFALYFLWPSFQESVNKAFNILTSSDEEQISRWVDQFGIWGPIIIILSMIGQMFLFIIPSLALMVVSVLAYGPFWGSVISLAAIMSASTVGYVVGRRLGLVTVDKLIGSKTEKKIEMYVDRYGFWAVVIARISPFLSNDAISFVGGLIRMGYWKFIMATGLGILPLIIFIAFLGQNIDRLKNGLFWISIISLIILIVYVIHDYRKRVRAYESLVP